MYAAFLTTFALCLGCGAGAEKTKLSTANNEFALSLYKTIADDNVGKNLIFSPISISTALAMVHAGAVGNTKKQMTTALHLQKFDDDEQEIQTQYHDFLSSLNKVENNFTLNMANGLFGSKHFTLKDKYLQDIKANFLGEVETLDYVTDSEGSRKRINDFAADHTNQKITELFPKGSISTDTSLVLVNAIYFKGFWKTTFDKESTELLPFHISKTEAVNVDMMRKNGNSFPYASDDSLHCQVIELPYVGGKASMYVILPNQIDGLTSLEQQLTTDKFYNIINKMSRQYINSLQLPKFEMKQDIGLIDFLKKLGITDLFQEANLSASFEGSMPQAVSEVLHKAYIAVNEGGTEAAAATGVAIEARSGSGSIEMNFIADHPFMYLIVEKKTSSILFLGRMTKPPVEGERIGRFAAQKQEPSSGDLVISVNWITVCALICSALML